MSLETLKQPTKVDIYVQAWSQTSQAWQREVAGHLKAQSERRKPTGFSMCTTRTSVKVFVTGKLLVIDSLNTIAAAEPSNLLSVLSAFTSLTTSLLAVYHTDVPSTAQASQANAYAPAPLTLLKYLATTVFKAQDFHHVLAAKAARERNYVEPVFGLAEGTEGLLQGRGANGKDGIVLEMEHRRKSGRGVREWYFLPSISGSSTNTRLTARKGDAVMLLEDHPLYRPSKQEDAVGGDAEAGSTFELGLTDKQRRDRRDVVLPYFDAQKGGGDGGRILYDMGSEDDFDEEEDEI